MMLLLLNFVVFASLHLTSGRSLSHPAVHGQAKRDLHRRQAEAAPANLTDCAGYKACAENDPYCCKLGKPAECFSMCSLNDPQCLMKMYCCGPKQTINECLEDFVCQRPPPLDAVCDINEKGEIEYDPTALTTSSGVTPASSSAGAANAGGDFTASSNNIDFTSSSSGNSAFSSQQATENSTFSSTSGDDFSLLFQQPADNPSFDTTGSSTGQQTVSDSNTLLANNGQNTASSSNSNSGSFGSNLSGIFGSNNNTTSSGSSAYDITTGSGSSAYDITTGSGSNAFGSTTGSGSNAFGSTTGSGSNNLGTNSNTSKSNNQFVSTSGSSGNSASNNLFSGTSGGTQSSSAGGSIYTPASGTSSQKYSATSGLNSSGGGVKKSTTQVQAASKPFVEIAAVDTGALMEQKPGSANLRGLGLQSPSGHTSASKTSVTDLTGYLAEYPESTLMPEAELMQGQELQGGCGYKLQVQEDGNAVLLDSTGTALWSSNTFGHGIPPYFLKVTADGRMGLFDRRAQKNPRADAIWETPATQPGVQLVVLKDGNVVLVDPTTMSIEWATDTAFGCKEDGTKGLPQGFSPLQVE